MAVPAPWAAAKPETPAEIYRSKISASIRGTEQKPHFAPGYNRHEQAMNNGDTPPANRLLFQEDFC